ncbi:MAG: class I SAM-dependent methyltransferase [Planctomycetaceae bacterium]|nr:class I SAM-dependent methyltransferase [Planctomycetaceae bacterium]
MDHVEGLLQRLYTEGKSTDAKATTREAKMLNITPSTGAFLDLLVRDSQPKRILEIGTSNGYSTIWLARAAKDVSAELDSVEQSDWKVQQATQNIGEAGLLDVVRIFHGGAEEFLRLSEGGLYDLIFLDSDRSAYERWWPDLLRVSRGGLFVVDKASTHPLEVAGFRKLVCATSGCSAVTVPIGNGLLVISGME